MVSCAYQRVFWSWGRTVSCSCFIAGYSVSIASLRIDRRVVAAAVVLNEEGGGKVRRCLAPFSSGSTPRCDNEGAETSSPIQSEYVVNHCDRIKGIWRCCCCRLCEEPLCEEEDIGRSCTKHK